MIGTTPRHAVPELLLVAMRASGSAVAESALAGPPDRAAAAKHAQMAERLGAGAVRPDGDARPPPRSGRAK